MKNKKYSKNKEPNPPILIVVSLNIICFIVWVFYYSVFHEHVSHFIFNVIGLPFYPVVTTMFLIYFTAAIPLSIGIYLLLKIFFDK